MTTQFTIVKQALKNERRRWLVTGAAGFIGSHLTGALLLLDQEVIGLDNFATGRRSNLEEVRVAVGPKVWSNFTLYEGDIRDLVLVRRACQGSAYVLHQAALGSVPLSIEDPIATQSINDAGFVNVLKAANEAGVGRVVYASSSAVYGDDPELPKVEEKIGNPLSPYAASKLSNEIYAAAFASAYGLQTVGLRYFNVFGPRQDPAGAYAAVIPGWIYRILHEQPCMINGDGLATRDFCFVENIVQANLLAALTEHPEALNKAYNIANGVQCTLTELYALLVQNIAGLSRKPLETRPRFGPARPGDVRHSHADISRAKRLLGYAPTHSVGQGLRETIAWYFETEQELACVA